VTSRPYGNGRITSVGTIPNPGFAAALFRWLVPPGEAGWRAVPASVTVTGATARDGRHLRFVHNWSWEPATLRLPNAVHDPLGDTDHDAGTEVTLGAWDVRVFADR
jgi:beta-galactosidase